MWKLWQRLPAFMLAHRNAMLVAVALLTIAMALCIRFNVAQDFRMALPKDDPDFVRYEWFKRNFGDDGASVFIAVAPGQGNILEPGRLDALRRLGDSLDAVPGIQFVLNPARLPGIRYNSDSARFEPYTITLGQDSLSAEAQLAAQPLFSQQLLDSAQQSAMLVAGIEPSLMDTEEKSRILEAIYRIGEQFARESGMAVHYAGLPVLRVYFMREIPKELGGFMAGAIVVAVLVLAYFFRAPALILIPLGNMAISMVCTMGIVGILGYDIILLTGIIPAIVGVISVPNFVYLITRYHMSYALYPSPRACLTAVYRDIGYVTTATNLTTAAGFAVLSFTRVEALQQFGLATSLSVMATFVVSSLTIPALLSYLPTPGPRQLRHLQMSWLNNFTDFVLRTAKLAPGRVLWITAACIAISLAGIWRLNMNTFMMDDIPPDSRMGRDLRAIEARYGGAMPYEILIDSRQKGGFKKLSELRKLSALQASLDSLPLLGPSLSAADALKAGNQSLMGGDPLFYDMPDNLGYLDISRASRKLSETAFQLPAKLADSTMQVARISARAPDIGAYAIRTLNKQVEARIAQHFDSTRYDVQLTGTAQLYMKGSKYLISSLLRSLLISISVIALIIGLMFKEVRYVLACLTPNILPLLMIAGIMGWAGVLLKPSSAIIFSISLGIAIDDSIHFLTSFRLARQRHKDDINAAIEETLQHTSSGIIYTSLILFMGFMVLAGSSFGGIQALGILISCTLLLAMFCNLFLMPVVLKLLKV